jgi:hypothetical protein
MAFFNEVIWEIWAWLSVAILSWGASLLFSRCRNFWKACTPVWYPSQLAYFVVLLVMNLVLGVAAYLTWALGGWLVYPYALSFAVGALFLVAVAHFVLFTWFQLRDPENKTRQQQMRRFIVLISSAILFLACCSTIAATVFFYFAGQMVSFALGIIYGIYVLILAIINVIMAWHDNGYQRTGGDGPCGCTAIDSGVSGCVGLKTLAAKDAKLAAKDAEIAALKAGKDTVGGALPGLGLELPPNIRGTSGYTAYRRL